MPSSVTFWRRRLCALALLGAAVVAPAAESFGDVGPDSSTERRHVRLVEGGEAGTAGIPASYSSAYRSAAERFGVDWRLLAAVGANESDHGASRLPGVHAGMTPSGVAGPAQLCVTQRCGRVWQTWKVDGDGDGRLSVHDPDDAFHTAARYVAWLGEQVGRAPAHLLAAYNAGPGSVHRHRGIPDIGETRRYVQAGTQLMSRL